MNDQHTFKISLNWCSKDESGNPKLRGKTKNHSIKVDGKQELQISAAKAFKGDQSLYNPEELLLSSLSSCHMMSYLYCCSIHHIEVISYIDNAEAILELNSNGSGEISKVILNPQVVIKDETMKQLAIDLHKKANDLCFIANSCKFPVKHTPVVTVNN